MSYTELMKQPAWWVEKYEFWLKQKGIAMKANQQTADAERKLRERMGK